MPLLTTVASGGVKGLGWSAPLLGEEELGVMLLIEPTSVSTVGGSATINSNGSITLTNVTEFALNGIFSSVYRNYIIQMNVGQSSGGDTFRFKFRSSGTNTSATSYYSQQLNAQGSSLYGYDGVYVQASPGNLGPVSSGNQILIYNPFPSGSVPVRSVGASSNGPEITDLGVIWGGSPSSFDGVWMASASGYNLNGTVCVYGLVIS